MAYEMRPIVADEFEEWIEAMERGFGDHDELNQTLHHPATGDAPWVELGRSVAVFDGQEIVGTSHSYTFEMTVPGGSLPIAGVSHVCVQPTHRRRGILTSMMGMQLADFHERGEPLSGLNTSETVIYGRYGYSVGSFREDWTIERQHTDFSDSAEPTGLVEFIPTEEVGNILPEVFARTTINRPGVVARSSAEWARIVADPPQSRGSASRFFCVAYYSDNTIDGYAIYRNMGNTLTVHELLALTEEAYSALWRFCFSVDLRTRTVARKRPVDDPLPHMLTDPRRLQRTVQDGFWLRLVDVKAALEGRQYRMDGRIVFEFTDPFCPWNEGRIRLEGGSGGARCTPTTESPDIGMSVTTMGSTYLGTVRFSDLARAGLAEEYSQGAIERADLMFSHQLKPWCPYTW